MEVVPSCSSLMGCGTFRHPESWFKAKEPQKQESHGITTPSRVTMNSLGCPAAVEGSLVTKEEVLVPGEVVGDARRAGGRLPQILGKQISLNLC